MADIAKLLVEDTEYELKDAQAREDLSTLQNEVNALKLQVNPTDTTNLNMWIEK